VGLSIAETPSPETDEQLIAACVAGEQAAQRILFRREYARVNATVYRVLGNARDADDLVQETFIAVFRGLARFRGESKLSTWIDRIAVRMVFQHLGRRRPTVSLDLVGDLEDAAAGVDDKAHAREGLRRLYGALAELTPEQRTAFALFAIDGRSIGEVAKLTGVSIVTAKLRIWRGRKELHKRAANDPVLADLVAGEEHAA
jgi:RNA polymerase sigma-70 factor, ECF subfamily